jgi:hypothetical protein
VGRLHCPGSATSLAVRPWASDFPLLFLLGTEWLGCYWEKGLHGSKSSAACPQLAPTLGGGQLWCFVTQDVCPDAVWTQSKQATWCPLIVTWSPSFGFLLPVVSRWV